MVGYNTWNPTILHTSRDQLLKLVSGRQAVVLIVPSRNLWVGPHQAEERRVHESFIGLLREAGVQVVDPSKALEAQGTPLAYHFKTDPHWNPRGHDAWLEQARELRQYGHRVEHMLQDLRA